MVDEQVGLRSNQPRELPLWTKLFSGFKVALDPKKLLLAAAGILVMSLGWWVLSLIFYSFPGSQPEWSDYKNSAYAVGSTEEEKLENAWTAFTRDLNQWNLRYAMMAPVPSPADLAAAKDNKARQKVIYYNEFDAWDTYKRYARVESEVNRLKRPVKIEGAANPKLVIEGGGVEVPMTLPKGDDATKLENLSKEGKLTAKDIAIPPGKEAKLVVAGVEVTANNAADVKNLQEFLAGARTIAQVREEARARNDQVTLKALAYKDYNYLRPAGQFRTLPWYEYRGPNPYLLVTESIKQPHPGASAGDAPWAGLGFFRWFAGDEVPVLLEPLFKFLRPIIYLLSPNAGFGNGLYLVLIILWMLFTWAVFGGAITRMAAVQVARTNEKIGMTEALRFAWSRVQGYFSAPVIPLIFVLILTILLWVYGLVGAWTLYLGDIVVYGLFAPIMLLIALIMAVVLVGLIGWPLMYSTISSEGSDSFDAISRSYSYVYQAPWNYLWYGLVALAYGAVVVFFVGFMGSLIVYLGKWGMELAPHPSDRAPIYLFVYSPTSFGWRDVLLKGSPSREVKEVQLPYNSGIQRPSYVPTDEYLGQISWNNFIAAVLVNVWLYLLFLMIVGFGYSYFWSASTIIYLLMRRKVDDTDLDEIHLEEEDLEEPYSPAATGTPATPADKGGPGGGSVTMVEAPTLRQSAPATASTGGTATSQVVSGPAAVETAVANPPAPVAGPVVAPPSGGNPGQPGSKPGDAEKT
jgi:hypothetical protein